MQHLTYERKEERTQTVIIIIVTIIIMNNVHWESFVIIRMS